MIVIEQFSDTGIVEVFDSLQVANIVVGNKVDGVTLSAKPSTSTDSKAEQICQIHCLRSYVKNAYL